jgi:UDP-N-acetylglucosamine 1-carboxyvinyltransferase
LSSSSAPLGVSVEWTGQNELEVHARELSSGSLDPVCAPGSARPYCLQPRCSPAAARSRFLPPGGDVIGRRRLDTHFLALGELGAKMELRAAASR